MQTTEQIKELDVVALLTAMPEERLTKGTIGTVVHNFSNGFYEVEFANLKGETYAMLTLPAEKLLVLKHEPEMV